ncbi:MAG: hypothetical protein Q4Q62_06815 [Thermoplasmata archaeon]|nr:hypothetical protein [Thermoplasmata archaeon]
MSDERSDRGEANREGGLEMQKLAEEVFVGIEKIDETDFRTYDYVNRELGLLIEVRSFEGYRASDIRAPMIDYGTDSGMLRIINATVGHTEDKRPDIQRLCEMLGLDHRTVEEISFCPLAECNPDVVEKEISSLLTPQKLDENHVKALVVYVYTPGCQRTNRCLVYRRRGSRVDLSLFRRECNPEMKEVRRID